MDIIDTILVRHGVDPTLLEKSDKARFDSWLTEAKTDALSGFWEYAEQIKQDTCSVGNKLSQYAAQLLQLLGEAKAAIEPLLGEYSKKALLFSKAIDNRALTARHLKMLEHVDHLKAHASALAVELAERETADNTSYAHMTQVSLRYIALCEDGKHESLRRLYGTLADRLPTLCETASHIQEQLIHTCNILYDCLSRLAKDTSATVTAINRSRAPQTDYFNLLQTFLLQIHALSEAAGRIQKEVAHVQISDVL